MGLGTSHNAGSDKQTYYKLGTQGVEGDTPLDFARTLTAGGCCHGDVALIEAENSLRSFYRLADLGVPFPHNERGGFVGYKTDHDPRQRATSAGPWTSRFMVQKLRAELERYGLSVFNRHYALAVVRDGEGACGLLCADMDRQDAADHGLVLFNCRNVVMAGGGPGELYEISVYPRGQMGPFAPLLEAGAVAHNLTESQFGLASLRPRWNLSGTYQQVIPRYFSTDADGGDEREFLNPFFDSMGRLATDIFLKGYQWPFDPQKIEGAGSSLIDVLVQNEMIGSGRRVWMDFRSNPVATDGLEEFRMDTLAPEARQYLERSGALQPTPIERLAHMNQPSIDLYAQMGVDLRKEPIEIGVCSQHCNGGFAVDAWWESNVPHLFVIGELAGTHGVKRPGGSALNSGQVGGLRAAQRIAHVYYEDAAGAEDFARLAAPVVHEAVRRIARVKGAGESALDCAQVKAAVQHRMSAHAGMVRSAEGVAAALAEARAQWRARRAGRPAPAGGRLSGGGAGARTRAGAACVPGGHQGAPGAGERLARLAPCQRNLRRAAAPGAGGGVALPAGERGAACGGADGGLRRRRGRVPHGRRARAPAAGRASTGSRTRGPATAKGACSARATRSDRVLTPTTAASGRARQGSCTSSGFSPGASMPRRTSREPSRAVEFSHGVEVGDDGLDLVDLAGDQVPVGLGDHEGGRLADVELLRLGPQRLLAELAGGPCWRRPARRRAAPRRRRCAHRSRRSAREVGDGLGG